MGLTRVISRRRFLVCRKINFSPPLPISTRLWIENPNLHLLRIRELIEFHVTVAEEHVEAAPPLVVVPGALGVRVAAIRVPRPVALEDLVRRAQREFPTLDRQIFIAAARGRDVANDMAGAEGIVLKLRQVARAVAEVAVLNVRAI